MDPLYRLAPQFRSLLSEDFLAGKTTIDVTKYTQVFRRQVDTEHLISIVAKAMDKFDSVKREESDRWLAPRVHAALRLTRREAADQGVWDWLAVVPLQPYVRWRWMGDERVGAERFAGREINKHAIARLWWGAELTRNGSDYSATTLLFVKQDIQNSWFKTKLFRHRPTAIASLNLLSTFKNGDFAGDEQRDLVKSLNVALTTTMLDAVAANAAVDADAMREWRCEAIDETQWFEEMPVGPPEQQLDAADVQAVRALLDHVVTQTKFQKRDRSTGKSRRQTAVANN